MYLWTTLIAIGAGVWAWIGRRRRKSAHPGNASVEPADNPTGW